MSRSVAVPRLSGLFAVNKPSALTSYDVVRHVARCLGVRRGIGHGGTLDPLAHGVLVIGVGTACKQLGSLLRGNKRYAVTARFGIATDSYDADGKITRTAPFDHITFDALSAAANTFVGRIQQTPPLFSAVHVNGVRAYELARRGLSVTLSSRWVNVYAFKLETFDPPFATFTVSCGGGAYVRALVSDVASAVQSAAHVTALQRTAHGPYTLRDAVEFADISADVVHRIIQPR